MRDEYTEALVNTMHHCLAKVQAETPRNTLHDVAAVASADRLADRLPEVRPKTRSEKLASKKTGGLENMRPYAICRPEQCLERWQTR